MFKVNPRHWAFKQGAEAGAKGDVQQRDMKSMGVSLAKDARSKESGKQWLSGFKSAYLK